MVPRPSSPSPLAKQPRKSALASTSASASDEGKLKKALKYPKRKAVDVKRSLSQSNLPLSSSSSTHLPSSKPTPRSASHNPSASTSSFAVPPAPASVASEPPTRIPSKLRKKSGDLRREKSAELKEKRSSGFARVLGRNKSADVLSKPTEQKRQISQPIVDFNPAHLSQPSSHPSSSLPSPHLGASSPSSVFSNQGSHSGLGEPWLERSSIDGPGVLGSPVSFSPSLPSLASPPRKLVPREARGSLSPNKRQSFTDTASVLSSPGMVRPGRQVSVKIVDAPGHEPVSMAEFFANDSDFSDSDEEPEPSTSAQREPRRQASQASVSSKGSKGRMRRISSGFSKLNKSLHDLSVGGGSGSSGDREKDGLASRFNKSLHNLADSYIVKPEKSGRSREPSPPFALQPATAGSSTSSIQHPVTPPRKGPRRSASLMTKFNKSLHDLADTLRPEDQPEYADGAKVSRRHSYIPRLVRSLSRNPSHASTGSISPAQSALVPPSPGDSYSAQSSILLESEPSLQFEPLVEEPEPAEIAERAEVEELITKAGPPVDMVPTSHSDQKPATTPSSTHHALPPVSPRFSHASHSSHARTPSSPGRQHDSLGIDFGVLLAEGRASTEVEIGHGDDVPRPTVRRVRGYTLSKSEPSAAEIELGELERLSGRVLTKEEARRSIVSVAASERELLRGLAKEQAGEIGEISRPETARPLESVHAETLDQLVASQYSEKPESSEPQPQPEPERGVDERKEVRRGTSLESAGSASVHSLELSTPAEELVPAFETHIPATIDENTQFSTVSPAFARDLAFDPVSPLKMEAVLPEPPVAFIQPRSQPQPQPIATQPLVDDSQLESSLESGVEDDAEERKLRRESTFEDLAQHYVSPPDSDAQHIEPTDEMPTPSHSEEDAFVHELDEELEMAKLQEEEADRLMRTISPATIETIEELPSPEFSMDEFATPAGIDFSAPPDITSPETAEEKETSPEEFATPTDTFETVLTRSVGSAAEYGDVEAVEAVLEPAASVEALEEPEAEGLGEEEPEDTRSLFEGTSALEAAAVASVAVAAPTAAFAAVSPVPAPRALEPEPEPVVEPSVEVAEPAPVVQSSPAIVRNTFLLKSAIEVPREVVQSSPAITKNTRLLKDAIYVPRVVRQTGAGITKNTALLKNAINVPRKVVQFSPAIKLLDELLRRQICVPRQVKQCSAAIDWNTQLIMGQIAVPREVKQSGAGISKNEASIKSEIEVPHNVVQDGPGIEKNAQLIKDAINVPRDVPQSGAGIDANVSLIKQTIEVPRDVPQTGPGIETNTALIHHALTDIPPEERWNYHPVVQSSPAIERNTALLKSAINVPRQVVQFSPAIVLLDQLLKQQICVPRQVPQNGPGIERNEKLLKHAIEDVPLEERWDYHPVEQEGPGIEVSTAIIRQAIEIPREVKQSGDGMEKNAALIKQAIEVPREVVQASAAISTNTALIKQAINVPREVKQNSPGIEQNAALIRSAIEVPREVPQTGLGIELNEKLLCDALLRQPEENAASEVSTPADEVVTPPVDESENSAAIALNESLLRDAICKPTPVAHLAASSVKSRSSSVASVASQPATPPSPVKSLIEKFEAAEVDALPLIAAEPPYSPPIERSRTLSSASQTSEPEAGDESTVAVDDGAEDTESARDDAASTDDNVPATSTEVASTATSTDVASDNAASNAVPCVCSQGEEEGPEATGAREEKPEDSEEGGSTEAPAEIKPRAPGSLTRLAPTPATNEHEPPAETPNSFDLVNAHSSTAPESSVPDTTALVHCADTDEPKIDNASVQDSADIAEPGETVAGVSHPSPSTSHPPLASNMAASPVTSAPRADVVVEVNPAPAAAPAPVPVVATPVPIVHATTAPVEHCHIDHARERQDALSLKAERIRAERAREADELWPHERPPLRYASPAPAAASATIVLPSITVQAPTPAHSLHHAPAPVLTKNQKKKARQKAKRQAARAAMTDSDTSSVVSSHHSHHAKSKKKGVEVETDGVKITVNADKEAREKREREEREAREKKEREEREAREKKEKEEREAREKKEKEEREAREKKEKEEREAKEKKEKEEREAKEKKEKEEKEAKEKREREEKEAREKKEREEREAREKKEKEEREAREKKERELAAAEAKLAAERAAAEAAALKAAEEAKAAAEKAEREAREAKEAEEKAAAERAAAEAAAEEERKEKEREERRRLRAERDQLLRDELELRKRELERAQYAEQLMAQQAAHAGPWRPPMPYGVPPPGLGFAGLNLALPPYAVRFPAPHPMMGPLGPIFHHPPGGFMPPPPGPGPRRY